MENRLEASQGFFIIKDDLCQFFSIHFARCPGRAGKLSGNGPCVFGLLEGAPGRGVGIQSAGSAELREAPRDGALPRGNTPDDADQDAGCGEIGPLAGGTHREFGATAKPKRGAGRRLDSRGM